MSMSNLSSPYPTPAPPPAPKFAPLGRIANIFVAPANAFAEVKRLPAWWFPYLIAVVFGLLYGYTILHKIGVPTLVDGIIRQSPSLQDRIAGSTPPQAQAIRTAIASQTTIALYVFPAVGSLIVGLIVAGVLLAAANFGAGGRATYGQMLGVWFYGALPLVLFFILVTIAVSAGLGGDQFNLKNPLGTNIGYYLMDGDSPKWLIALLSAVDLFAIWTALLVTLGVSAVAGIKRGAAAAIVFGGWFLWVLIAAGLATLGG